MNYKNRGYNRLLVADFYSWDIVHVNAMTSFNELSGDLL